MSSQLLGPSQFTDAIGDALREDVATADRLITLVNDEVPTQFPGRLLLSVTEYAPQDVEYWRGLDAAIAIEYAVLHQYIHAIPRAERPLLDPARHSVYATDTVAAILDGDFLQSCAFSRLTAATEDPDLAESAFGWISRASTECYERTIEATCSSKPPSSAGFAPLSGVAARVGTRLGGGSQKQAKNAERAARSIAAAVPVALPTGTTNSVGISERTEAIQTLAESITGGSSGDTQARSRTKDARRAITQLVREYRQ